MAGLSDIAQVDAGQGISAFARGRGMAMQEDEAKMARDITVGKIVSQGALSADTPEKWSGFVGMLQKRFPQADLSPFADFSARQPMVDQLRNYASERSDARADARATETNKIARERLEIERANAGGNKPPPGYRWKADGSMEAIPGGPAAAGKTANAPPGYRWNADNSGLEPIPGGPAEKLPAELAARVGMADEFLAGLPDLKQDIARGKATGPVDYVVGSAGWGRSGEIHRRIASGADALQRMLTGAGMNIAEAKEYADRYRPTVRDDAAVLTDKIGQLERELTKIKDSVMRGRGGAPTQTGGAQPAAGGQGGGMVPPPANRGAAATDPRIDQARAAISRGADPAAVKKRLMDMGIDPGAL